MTNNTISALGILERVYRGTDTMDSQSANEVWKYIQELQDKLHHRNQQIKELKKKVAEYYNETNNVTANETIIKVNKTLNR